MRYGDLAQGRTLNGKRIKMVRRGMSRDGRTVTVLFTDGTALAPVLASKPLRAEVGGYVERLPAGHVKSTPIGNPAKACVVKGGGLAEETGMFTVRRGR